MKIVEPKIYLVGRQMDIFDQQLEAFLADHEVADWDSDAGSPSEHLVEVAGRVCYMSFKNPRPGGNKAYLNHIMEVGHGSVLEHAVWNFIFTGTSRSLTHELIRHRAGWAYSMLSQRYVDESVAEYVEPGIIASDPELHDLWLKAITHAHQSYVTLAERLAEKLRHQCSWCGGTASLESLPATCAKCGGKALHGTELRKAARQAARSVLPNATETKIFVTANARALRHFIEMRASRHADTEIRNLAIALLRIMQAEAPNLFGDYKIEPLPDGTFEATTEWRKV